jgi:ubiquinone/menaquinone biosynthesis C-methylase UbiE
MESTRLRNSSPFAGARSGARMAAFRHGDAMALPFPENRFDAAVMALVIFFVPDPVKAVAEMVRW